MNKYKTTLLLATALLVVSSTVTHAGTLTVINKLPTERVQLCIRGEGSKKQSNSDCFRQVVEPGAQVEYNLNKENVQGAPTFEVIASTGNGGNPDWKLMGGKCSNLITGANYILTIDSTLGKLSCEAKSAVNLSN